ncbi:hypothetical protein D3C71_1408880 [compost metagenome]
MEPVAALFFGICQKTELALRPWNTQSIPSRSRTCCILRGVAALLCALFNEVKSATVSKSPSIVSLYAAGATMNTLELCWVMRVPRKNAVPLPCDTIFGNCGCVPTGSGSYAEVVTYAVSDTGQTRPSSSKRASINLWVSDMPRDVCSVPTLSTRLLSEIMVILGIVDTVNASAGTAQM